MAIVKIKKWKARQIGKTYHYDVPNEKKFIQKLLERDKSRGYYRHIGEMNTCVPINPTTDAKDCINYRFGIQLCDDKDNFKSYIIDYPINPPAKTKKKKYSLSEPLPF